MRLISIFSHKKTTKCGTISIICQLSNGLQEKKRYIRMERIQLTPVVYILRPCFDSNRKASKYVTPKIFNWISVGQLILTAYILSFSLHVHFITCSTNRLHRLKPWLVTEQRLHKEVHLDESIMCCPPINFYWPFMKNDWIIIKWGVRPVFCLTFLLHIHKLRADRERKQSRKS